MKSKVHSPSMNNKKTVTKKFLKRLFFKSLVVLAIVLILVFIKNLNLKSTNNLLQGLKSSIEYEFHIVEDSKKIYNQAKELIGYSFNSTFKNIKVFNLNGKKYDPPLSGTIYSEYGKVLVVDGQKVKTNGVDVKLRKDEDPKAIINGTVSKIYKNGSKGYYVTLKNEELEITYGYLSAPYVNEGDSIKVDQVIGKTGTSKDGNKYLRIEVAINGEYVDPVDYINFPESI